MSFHVEMDHIAREYFQLNWCILDYWLIYIEEFYDWPIVLKRKKIDEKRKEGICAFC